MSDEMYGSVRERELSGKVAFLREQMRALTEERDAFIASLEREAQVADALRARVAEVEAALSLQEDARFKLHDEAQALRAERDAAQQRAKALEVCLARELTKEEAP